MVTGVTFNFDISSITSQNSHIVVVNGYTGTGSISTADATAAATELTTYNADALGLNQHSIDLGAAGVSLVESLAGTSQAVALRLQGQAFGVNTQVYSIEQAAQLGFFGVTPPSLTVTYSAVPEPASATLMAVAGVAIVFSCRRRFSKAN